MYVTIEEYKEYAESLNVKLPALDDDVNAQLLKASEYIDSKDCFLIGTKAERDQEYSYPRKNLVLGGFEYTPEEIPIIVKKCQMALALEINSGIDIFEESGKLPIIKERVEGAVEVQYANPTKTELKQRSSVAMNLLRQLLKQKTHTIPLIRT